MDNYWRHLLLLFLAIISTSTSVSTDSHTSANLYQTTENTTASDATVASSTIITTVASSTIIPTVTTEKSSPTVSSSSVTTSKTSTPVPYSATSTSVSTDSHTSANLYQTTENTTASDATVASSTIITTVANSTIIPTVTTEKSSPTSTASVETTIGSSQAQTNSMTPKPSLGTTVKPTAAPSGSKVMISETNFLLTNSDSYFLEMNVTSSDVAEIWLVILSASDETLLHNQSLKISKSGDGIVLFVVKNNETNLWSGDGIVLTEVKNNETNLWNKMRNLEAVLIALYSDKENAGNITKEVDDILLYSSSGNITDGLREKFGNQNLIIDYSKLKNLTAVSLSRCSDGLATTAVVLTNQSRNATNFCNWPVSTSLEMKLTSSKECSEDHVTDFDRKLENAVISEVNKKELCGFSWPMMTDLKVIKACNKSKGQEFNVGFTVRSAFKDQLSLIKNGYQSLLNDSQIIKIDEENFVLHACSGSCFSTEPPATNRGSDENRIRVTVAVVVSCIGVFLIVLLLVVLYLRKKKKAIFQFRMARLDEDDDLIGDMDDFVGNQGPTFRSFR